MNSQAWHETSIQAALDCPKYLNGVKEDSTCTKYYSCTTANGITNIKYFTCPFGQYFNIEKQSCVYGLSLQCYYFSVLGDSKETISGNITRNRRDLLDDGSSSSDNSSEPDGKSNDNTDSSNNKNGSTSNSEYIDNNSSSKFTKII